MRYPKSRCTLTIFSIMVMFVSCSVDDNQLPNILIILADDMGYSDIGCYGGEINTPNLDNLAKNGVQFTQFYNTARCCPTRGSLLTGIYPHECGIGHMTHANGGGAYTGYLLNTCVTIPELLADAGYATSISGKWHAGTVRESWPENRGFQRSYSIHNWVDSYFKVLGGCEVFEDGKIILPRTDNPGEIEPQPNNKEWYTTDVFASKTIQFIDEAEAQQKPFFHYLAFNAPHWPLEAHDSVIAKYLDKYEEGYEELRKSKYQKMIDMGLVNANWDYPEQLTPNWDELSDSVKQDTRFRRAIYAAQVEIMDENIGRIVNHLKEKGNLDNTLIFFLSDNGCASEPMKNWFGYTWGKNTKWNYPQWRKNSARAGASQGKVWAITSNTPFQKYKRYTFEGGISTPLIVHWPDGVEQPGRMESKPGHLVDIMATCLEVAGVTYPKQRNGIDITPARGISLYDELKGKKGKLHEYLFWEHEGRGALRHGDWKLVSDKPADRGTWKLHNLADDRTEVHDLSGKYPDKRQEMIVQWEKMANAMKVWPKPTKYKPNKIDK